MNESISPVTLKKETFLSIVSIITESDSLVLFYLNFLPFFIFYIFIFIAFAFFTAVNLAFKEVNCKVIKVMSMITFYNGTVHCNHAKV